MEAEMAYDYAQLVKIAQVAHEINKAYCEAIGDNSQLSWEDAPDWQKDSAMKSVLHNLVNPDSKISDELPVEQRVRDYLFKQVVESLIKF